MSNMFNKFRMPIILGFILGFGFIIGRYTAPAVILEVPENIKQQAQLLKNIEKELELTYYRDLLKKPKREVEEMALKLEPEPEKKLKAENKSSPDHIAQALAKVLGEQTPESVQEVISHSLPTSTGSAYAIQVASLQDRESAEKLIKRWLIKGHEAKLVQAELTGIGKVYRVRIHGFDTRDEAEAYRIRKQLEGISVAQ